MASDDAPACARIRLGMWNGMPPCEGGMECTYDAAFTVEGPSMVTQNGTYPKGPSHSLVSRPRGVHSLKEAGWKARPCAHNGR